MREATGGEPAGSAAKRDSHVDRAARLARTVEPYRPGLTREAAAARAGVEPGAIVKLSSNENPLGPPPAAKAAVARVLDRLHEYPSATADELRAALAGFHGVDSEQIVVGAGSSSLMHAMVAAFTAPGGEVVALDPSFSVYREIAHVHGRRPVTVPLREGDFSLDLDRFAAALTEKTQLVFLTRPNNPTSTLIPLEDFERAARMAAASGALVVSDEAYIEFADVPSPSAVALVRGPSPAHANVLVSRTFSKAFGLANLRLGYAIAARETAHALALANAKWPTGAVAQAAGIAALGDRNHLDRTLQCVREGRTALVRGFERLQLRVAPDPQGNYIMVDVSSLGLTAAEFTERVFAAARILIRGDFSPRHVRISVGQREENARLLDAVAAIVAAPR